MASRQRARPGEPDWEREFTSWLGPFLAMLPRTTHRKWAPKYVEGLLSPSARKSVEPIAALVAAEDYDQLHHFLTTPAWDAAAWLAPLAARAQAMVGGPGSVLIIDDTALRKKGMHSVGVARQYCGEIGKLTNCQVLVSLTVAKAEVPVPVALRLFLPEAWAADPARCARAKIPRALRVHRPKWDLALEELDRVRAAGVTVDAVLADAGYGVCAAFREGLTARGLRWGVGVPSDHAVYPVSARVLPPGASAGRRPRTTPRASVPSVAIATLRPALHWRRLTWRQGTKGPLAAEFTRRRVRATSSTVVTDRRKLPGEACWLVGERRSEGSEHWYLSNLPATASLRTLATLIKRRWCCEQAHEQLKNELGLDHFEGRSWPGLTHHLLLSMIAYAFLQHRRLEEIARGGKKTTARPAAPSKSARHATATPRRRAADLRAAMYHPWPLHPRAA
jgi:SRSO17 transposase